MIPNSKLKWIASAGGPLVLMESSIVTFWRGVEGSDYDDAGDVHGYLGLLKRAGRDILVIWGEPTETAYYRRVGDEFLVQWLYAPDEEAALKALASVPSGPYGDEGGLEFQVVEPTQLMFDAGAPGDLVAEFVTLALEPGRYVIHTLDYTPTKEINLVVHQFVRIDAFASGS